MKSHYRVTLAMPSSVNGFGTGLIAASRKRKVDGHTQFDAIEAVMLAYCPIIPCKALHVLSIWQEDKDYEKERFQSFPLRLSSRLIVKAFCNRWGNGLSVFAGLMLVVASFTFATMERPFGQGDRNFLIGAAAFLLIGILMKVAWLIMSKTDERIKDIIGPHEFGTSDPVSWPSDVAQAATEAILKEKRASSLVELAQRVMADGHASEAMLYVRLAMQDTRNVEAQDLFDRLLRDRLLQI